MQQKRNGRLWQLDFWRGVAAWAVVIQHVYDHYANILPAPYWLGYFVRGINVPLFFLISGYLGWDDLHRPFNVFFKKKTSRLFLPYCSWSLLAIAAKFFTGAMWSRPYDALVLLVDTLFYGRSMWFFLSLYLAFLLARTFLWLNKKASLLSVSLIIVFCLLIQDRTLPLTLGHTGQMLPFFFLGLFARAKTNFVSSFFPSVERWSKKNFYLYGFAILGMTVAVWGTYAYEGNVSAQWFLRLPLQLLITICTMYLLLPFANLFWVKTSILKMGNFSMEIYGIHMMLISYFSLPIPQAILSGNQVLSSVVLLVWPAVICGLCCFLAQFLLHRIPLYRWLMLGDFTKEPSKPNIRGNANE